MNQRIGRRRRQEVEIGPPDPLMPHGPTMRNHQVSIMQKSHSGPLPAAEDFAAYGEVLPSAPERILAMAEGNQVHRHKLEDRAMTFQAIERIGSRLIAGLFASGCIFAAVYVAPKSESLAVTIAATTIGGVVWAFISQPRARRQKPDDKT
ncbi:MAG: DUF2335 domain-containing protein [Rhizobiales bacterium]|nr:DUF2335 domain-containing protein [Hyphomicrobiales bacterium]